MSPPAARASPPKASIRVEVGPDDPTGMVLDRSAPRDPALAVRGNGNRPIDRLRELYLDQVADYQAMLGSWIAEGDAERRTSRHPELRVTLDRTETLAIDAELFERLFEIYVVHGWNGVRAVDRALDEFAGAARLPVMIFYRFTRSLLAMLIRDALKELERRAAARAIANLSVTAAAVSKAWTAQYKFKRTETTTRTYDREGEPIDETTVTYRIGEQAEAEALFTALTETVKQRVAYESVLQDVARLRDHARAYRATAKRARERGKPLSSEAALETELKLKEQQSQQLQDRAESWLKQMRAVIGINSPLGLLLVESLRPGFKQEQMEDLLGATVWELYRSLDDLAAGIDPEVSRAARTLREAGIASAQAPTGEIGRALFSAAGPEALVADAAVKGLAGDRGWFPLLHAGTLNELIERGEIGRDSFTYVVFAHYTIALNERLEAEARDEAASRAFWQAFAKVAAAASLLLLLTPAAGLGLVARGAAAVVDLVLMAHAVSSVTQQLARLDQLKNQQLLDPDAFSVEALGRLGELGVYGEQLRAGLTQQLLIELLAIAVGAKWAPLKNLLIFRGYMQDVETLLSDD